MLSALDSNARSTKTRIETNEVECKAFRGF